jgi:hypothetical protein
MSNSHPFLSRKLLLTIAAIAIVAGSDLMGLDLNDETLSAVVTMVLGLVGGQALVDVAGALKSGRAVADVVEDVKEAADADEA